MSELKQFWMNGPKFILDVVQLSVCIFLHSLGLVPKMQQKNHLIL